MKYIPGTKRPYKFLIIDDPMRQFLDAIQTAPLHITPKGTEMVQDMGNADVSVRTTLESNGDGSYKITKVVMDERHKTAKVIR